MLRPENVRDDAKHLLEGNFTFLNGVHTHTELEQMENATVVPMSNHTEEGIMKVKQTVNITHRFLFLPLKACDILLSQRVESRLQGSHISSVLNRVHVAVPKPRDNNVKELSCAKYLMEIETTSTNSTKRAQQTGREYRQTAQNKTAVTGRNEAENSYDNGLNMCLAICSSLKVVPNDYDSQQMPDDWDPTKYSIDWRSAVLLVASVLISIGEYLLANDDWKFDPIPEIYNGKNIADFVDPDILKK